MGNFGGDGVGVEEEARNNKKEAKCSLRFPSMQNLTSNPENIIKTSPQKVAARVRRIRGDEVWGAGGVCVMIT